MTNNGNTKQIWTHKYVFLIINDNVVTFFKQALVLPIDHSAPRPQGTV
jgi:hypothetical protein